MVGSSAWQWTGGVGGHGGSGKERKEGDGMEGTREKLQVEEYVRLLQCVWAHKAASKQARMLMWEADWETCLRHCWGQQDFGRSSAFVGGGAGMGRRESEGWKRRRKRKREGFCCGTSATAVWRWQGHVRPDRLRFLMEVDLESPLPPCDDVANTSGARSHALSPGPQSAGGSRTWACSRVKGSVCTHYETAAL